MEQVLCVLGPLVLYSRHAPTSAPPPPPWCSLTTRDAALHAA